MFYWHIHHEVLCEELTEPIQNRIAFIKLTKPFDQIATRLRLMRPVRGTLPASFFQAVADRRQEQENFFQAQTAWNNARPEDEDYQQLREAAIRTWEIYKGHRLPNSPDPSVELEALHAIECPDCPWDGHTIFPEDQ